MLNTTEHHRKNQTTMKNAEMYGIYGLGEPHSEGGNAF